MYSVKPQICQNGAITLRTFMSYLVLARKWRPKRFAELVGQQHVVRALSHALETGRIHHAFLFSGTRGVGKTTIARIFAKSLNCETGTSSEPCGVCGTCLEIDNGRYPDLIEIDAASHTGVDNIRDLIENAQYMPARGRIKVYLIDEVHMLSKPAFNALLKTLEEPPEHVKFLLATTDPEKLPVTVLSRCLQFNLRRLDQEQIDAQMQHILKAENIAFDQESISQLAFSADGSLRDGLSLLDQAIAYSGGELKIELVQAMLGTVDRTQIEQLLKALCSRDGDALMLTIDNLSAFSPDFGQVLDRLAESLHEIQVVQLVPNYQPNVQRVSVKSFAESIDPQIVQIWYQMAILGRKDLSLAPSARLGFEMCLLRMLAFLPVGASMPAQVTLPISATSERTHTHSQVRAQPAPIPETSVITDRKQETNPRTSVRSTAVLNSNDDWLLLVQQLNLRGPDRELGLHASYISYQAKILKLAFPADFHQTLNDSSIERLQRIIHQALGDDVQLKIECMQEQQADNLFTRETQKRSDLQNDAVNEFQKHPVVSALLQEGAKILPDSIQPLELK
jgi:DNA polymerase-3 subunit gamma/tau